MIDIENRDFEYYFKEGKKLLFDSENPKDALNLFNKAIELNPNSSEALSLRGRCKLEMFDVISAIKDFREVIESNSANRQDFISYFISRGLFFFLYPKFEESNETGIKNFIKAIELDISKEDAYLIIPALKSIIKNIDYEIVINPENNQNYFLRVSEKYALGESYDLIDAEDSQEKINCFKKYWEEVRIENAKWNYQNAIKDFDKVIGLNSESEVALLRRGICKYRSGYLKDSVKDFDTLILIKPDSAEAYAYKGIVQCKTKVNEERSILKMIKRIKDANANFKKAIDLDTNFSYLNQLIEENNIFLNKYQAHDINDHVF